LGGVRGSFGVLAGGSAFTIVTFTSCGLKSVAVRLPGFDADLPCSECGVGSCDCTGDPVRTGSGNMRLHDADPIPGSDLFPLRRTFDSRGLNSAPAFGHGWTSLFDTRMSLTTVASYDQYMTVRTEDGAYVLFVNTFGSSTWSQVWPTDTSRRGRLEVDPVTGEFTHSDADGRRARIFSAGGRILRYRDLTTHRDVVFTYTNGRVTRLDDSWGAWAWNVVWDNDRIASISVDGNSAYTLTYHYQGALNRVATIAGTWRKYGLTYNANHLRYNVSSVRDADDRELEKHTFDGESRALSSFGPSGDIAGYEHWLPGRIPREKVTRLTWASGKIETHYVRAVAGRLRTVEISGGCSSCASGGDAVFGYDAAGDLARKQDARGYITRYTWDGSRRMLTSEGPFRPTACDPETDAAHCRLDPDVILTTPLASTADTALTTYTYGNVYWPDRPTTIVTSSVRNPAANRTQTLTYDTLTGTVTTQSVTGWTGLATPQQETRTTTTTLYNGSEGAAFNPGGAFDPSWLALPQPLSSRKAIDGPRSDVSDVTTLVYYPAAPSVPQELRGRLAASRNANETTRFEEYDRFGNARRVIDAKGVVTESTYDLLGRLTSSTVKGLSGCDATLDPLCATDLTTARTYYGNGPLATETRPGGGVTKWTYDSRARLETVSRGPSVNDLRERIETIYDPSTSRKAHERVLGLVNGVWVERKSESWNYDNAGRLVSYVHPDANHVDYTYTPDDSIASVRDERHTQPNTSYTYHPDGHLAAVTQTLGAGTAVTTYDYDLHGNLTSVTDPNGNTTTYLYDDFGQLLRQTSPVTGVTTYTYDAAGNLLTSTDANGAVTTRTYDVLGRVTSAETTRSDADPESVTWIYNDAAYWSTTGNRTMTMSAGLTGWITYSHDRRGLLLREERNYDETRYTYDADGNRASIVYPSGMTVTYTHDYAGRPITAYKGTTPLVTSATYLPFGPATSITYGNGTTRSMSYDTRYRMLGNALAGAGNTIAAYQYTHDPAGNILSITDTLDPAYNRTFGYDDLNRLITANTGAALWQNGSYTYDAMGNLLSSTLGSNTASFSYQSTTPKIVTATENGVPRGVAYDAAGNERSVGAKPYFYTARNSLASDGLLTYTYDGRGVRVSATSSWDVSSVSLSDESTVGGGTLGGSVDLTWPAPAGGIAVTLLSDSSAVTVPPSITIPAGQSAMSFPIATTAVTTSVTATIVASIGVTPRAATLEIQPLAVEGLEVQPGTLCGGLEAEGWVELNGPAPAGGAVINLASGSAAATVPGTVTVPEGEDGVGFSITTGNVQAVTPVTLTAAYGSSQVEGELELMPPSVEEVWIAGGALLNSGSTTGMLRVCLPAPAGGTTIALTTDRSDLVSLPATVTVAEGQREAQFTITSVAPAAATTSAHIIASAGGLEEDTSLTIYPPTIASVVLTPSTVEGRTNASVTVTLSEPAAAGTTITFTSSSSRAQPPASLVIPAGQTSASTVLATEYVTTESTVVITAHLQPWSASATLTLQPLAVTLASINVTPQSVVGSNDATLTITLTAAAGAGGVEVDLRGFNNAIVPQPPYVLVPPGATSLSVPVTTTLVAQTSTVTLRARHAATDITTSLDVTPPNGNHVVALALVSPRAVGGDLVDGTVTLAAAAPSGGATITLTSSNPLAASVPSTLTIPQGDTSGTFAIDTEAVTQPFDVSIRAAYNGTVQRQQLTVVPSPQAVTLESVAVDPFVYGGDDATGTVTLSAAAQSGGATVTLTGSRNGIATVPASVTVPAGSTSATFAVTTAAPSMSYDRGAIITAAYNHLARTAILYISRG
ncbi:MAG TPA: DUF6531 domain-containing protein, partial [Thermoanaerobaculia bacterium]